ncbi:MAG: tRNA (adenosine(37)-N6)-threonylcarbamoyltransferase complex ATPase subunit type 1 TsaE [Treponema sp.]|nr:tRNA (adenosine(37)-N6)-threonylcarbamoyltransferase complex ATPase subunit type 1 TsaE [Treponema sp.]
MSARWTRKGASLFETRSSSPEETAAAGARLAALVGPGTVLALSGPLGAGKTCLTAGLARALGVRETVTSPSYALIQEYEARGKAGALPFYHIDAYRLSGEDDFYSTGGEELLYGKGVSVIEWPERIGAALPAEAIRVTITIEDDDMRRIQAVFPEEA